MALNRAAKKDFANESAITDSRDYSTNRLHKESDFSNSTEFAIGHNQLKKNELFIACPELYGLILTSSLEIQMGLDRRTL